MDEDEVSHQGSILKSENRRDTIAGFFHDDGSSPVKQNIGNLSLHSDNATMQMEMSSPVTSKNDLVNCASPVVNSPAPVLERKTTSRTRDSIACFFESPKYRSIITTQDCESTPDSQEGQEAESCVDMETSSLSSISEDIPEDLGSQNESSQNSNHSQEKGKFSRCLTKDLSSQSSVSKSKTPSPKTSRRSSRRYSMTPSPLKEQSSFFSNQVDSTRSSPKTRLAQAMSSPYTPKVRSKLSQCITMETETSPFEEKQELDEPLTQSDVSLSQNTMFSSQEPSVSRELFDFKPKSSAIESLEFEKEDNESIRNEHGN
jgi:hypothetical protein